MNLRGCSSLTTTLRNLRGRSSLTIYCFHPHLLSAMTLSSKRSLVAQNLLSSLPSKFRNNSEKLKRPFKSSHLLLSSSSMLRNDSEKLKKSLKSQQCAALTPYLCLGMNLMKLKRSLKAHPFSTFIYIYRSEMILRNLRSRSSLTQYNLLLPLPSMFRNNSEKLNRPLKGLTICYLHS